MSLASVRVTVPATSANLGAGFDCIGVALSLHNQFDVALSNDAVQPLRLTVSGTEADRVKLNATNLAYRAFCALYQAIQQPVPSIEMHIALEVPLSRGLGSSATAIVGGLVSANALAGSPLSQAAVMQLAIELEGHPDNVVPALLGGCQLAARSAGDGDPAWTIAPVPWHPEIVPIVAVPNFELSTSEARQVLPSSYSRADAIFNVSHLGLLLRGLDSHRPDWLTAALQDRIHQPYRRSLIAGYDEVEAAARQAGAYGLVISGAGPTLLALADAPRSDGVVAAIAQAWTRQGAIVKPLSLDLSGARVS